MVEGVGASTKNKTNKTKGKGGDGTRRYFWQPQHWGRAGEDDKVGRGFWGGVLSLTVRVCFR